jgi:hypothetical protein
MARVWITYREGLRLLGHVVASVPMERTVSRLDIATWRLFAAAAPEEVSGEQVRTSGERKRVLLEVGTEDARELTSFKVGCFYESPYSPAEALRRLGISTSAEPPSPAR